MHALHKRMQVLKIKNGPIPVSFSLFLSVLITFQILIEMLCLGVQTRGYRIAGTDGSTELWRLPSFVSYYILSLHREENENKTKRGRKNMPWLLPLFFTGFSFF